MPPEGMSRPLEAAPSGSNSGDPWQRPMILLRVVLSDLVYLHEKWDQTIEETWLRVTSPILRRLLVEGVLQRARCST